VNAIHQDGLIGKCGKFT